jgi:hypothetical protein
MMGEGYNLLQGAMAMTITLNSQTETKLLEKARRDGQDPNELANEALWKFLAADTPEVSNRPGSSLLPPEQSEEDPRLTILREIDARSQGMNPKASGRDFLREPRGPGAFRDA